MKKVLKQNRREISLLRAELEDQSADIEAYKAVALDIKDRQDNSLKGVCITVAGSVMVAVIAAGALIYTDDDPAPEPRPAPVVQVIDCPDVKANSRDLYFEDGFWTDLPASSPAQEQCSINEYIVDLAVPGADTPGGGKSTSSFDGAGGSSSNWG